MRLGTILSDRYNRTGAIADAEAALDAQQRAVAATPRDSADWPGQLTGLGNRYLDRWKATGIGEDLNFAVDWHERAVRATPADSSELAAHLANWGVSLRNRHTATGDPGDLDLAISAHARAVSATPAGSKDLAGHLAGWAAVLNTRHQRTGDLADLDRAIDTFSQAAAARVDTSGPMTRAAAGGFSAETHTTVLTGWGTCLRQRYMNTRDRADLEQAISLCEEAVANTAPKSADRVERLSHLAGCLVDRSELDGNSADLTRAIGLYREAHESSHSADRWGTGVALADTLLKQDSLSDEEARECVALCEEAVSNTHEGSPLLPSFLGALANALRRGGRAADEPAATGHYRRCCQLGLRSSPRTVLATANLWGGWATERGQWHEATEAYQYGMDALQAMVGRQLSRSDKETWLTGTRRFAAGLAYARVMTGDLDGAVGALEQGRARLLAEALQRPMSEPAARQPGTATDQEADTTSIAYVAAAIPGGVALIVRPDAPVSHVLLPALKSEALRERTHRHAKAYAEYLSAGELERWEAELDDLGHWLWATVMGDVLATLPSGAAELVLIPCGYLGLLPLHAAWTEDPAAPHGRRYALDDVRISYSANTRAREAARQMAARTSPDSMLIVEDPDAQSADPMAGATREVSEVAELFARSGPLRDSDPIALIRREAATRDTVMAALDRYSVLHLCCHGTAKQSDPLRGGLLMAEDDILTVQDVMRRRRTPARLAVLPACESAMMGAELPDEVVSLPTGLIEAGVAGAVGSLWAVQGPAVAKLVTYFYRFWRDEGLEPCEALRQAQRKFRDRSHVPHPSVWSAMTYTGA
ncbi:CHAT domain-containing protein [Nonomuraea insulae]|uniref:CHAT domain-containing protein n=1 Tax=Nonomuraea insulae TaxID=1616787 RepID=A0ABW1CG40_9ACTN